MLFGAILAGQLLVGTTADATGAANPVELQKVSSGPAIPGSSFDYTIAVGNIGACTLSNVRVNDVLTGPAGTTIVSTEPASTITPATGGFNLAFPDIGPIAPNGRVTLRIRVAVPQNAEAGSRYDDRVTVAADCDGTSFTRSHILREPTVEPRSATAPCNISASTKDASHIEVYAGEAFAYFVNLYGSGSEPCTGTTITDALDPRVTFVSCSDGCSRSGRTITWNVGTLAPGQSSTFRAVVQVNQDATGTLPNTARADTNETAPVDLTTPGPRITGRSICTSCGFGSTTLTITTATLPDGDLGAFYNAALQATGGTTPYTWSIETGTLPAGLSLNTSSGAISGTPTGPAGASTITVKARDSAAQTATRQFTITIRAATTLTAEPAILNVKFPTLRPTIITASARLATSVGDTPLPGQTIRFVAGTELLCTAVTAANGVATCPPVGLTGIVATVLHLGYTASFDGTQYLYPSSANGPLIGGLKVLRPHPHPAI